jgi:hypothetical protein
LGEENIVVQGHTVLFRHTYLKSLSVLRKETHISDHCYRIKLVALHLFLFYQDALSGSSTGWTDEKHMLYISSLELSFVTKLYDGEVNSNGVLCWSPSGWRHKTHDGNHRNTQVDQVFTISSHSSIRTNQIRTKIFGI